MGALKFKPGDSVRRINGRYAGMKPGDEDEVVEVTPRGLHLKKFEFVHIPHNFVLIESAPPTTGEPVYAGHHPDGSSIQNHSAGPLYPYVLIWKDKKGGPDANGKYDVGVLGPRIHGTIWCPSMDAAVELAELVKEMK